jgi:hypothetical protein
MDKTKLLELRRELLDTVDRRTSTKEDLVAIIEKVSNKMLRLYLAEKLDEEIAMLEAEDMTYRKRCELSDLKAHRALIEEINDADVASMETSMGM